VHDGDWVRHVGLERPVNRTFAIWSSQPEFPLHHLLDRVLRYYARTPEHPAKQRVFNWLCRHLLGGRPLEVVVAGGLRLRLRSEDFIERTLIFDDWHEPMTTRFVLANLAAGQTAFIAGSHSGYFVLQAARAVGPTGRVVTCEPVPASLAATLDHLRLNDLSTGVTCLCTALGAENDHVRLALPETDFCMVSLSSPSANAPYLTRVSTLANALSAAAAPSPDLVLLDVEGFEWAALRGLGTNRPRWLIIESDPRLHAQRGESQAAFFDFVRSLGYALHTVLGEPVTTTGFFPENNVVAIRTNQPAPRWSKY